jgi:hypothetical protein
MPDVDVRHEPWCEAHSNQDGVEVCALEPAIIDVADLSKTVAFMAEGDSEAKVDLDIPGWIGEPYLSLKQAAGLAAVIRHHGSRVAESLEETVRRVEGQSADRASQ